MPITQKALSELSANRATGALHLEGGGTFYLTEGRVTHAESPAAPRVEDLLLAHGRISGQAVRQAMRAGGTGGSGGAGGAALLAQGVLTRVELEFCVLCTVLDAVFFLLGSPVRRTLFRRGERHWLGPQRYFDMTGLLRECARRRTQLDRTWPSADLDSLPVVPVGRVPAQRVVLTSLQWEIVACADATATPVELAHRLGRPAYAVLLAVRQLAAAGLLRLPRGEITAAPERGELPRRVAGASEIGQAGAGAPYTRESTRPPTGPLTGPLPELAGEAVTAGDPADVDLLIRLRDALEALT
ncbi:DUF4388 domain-containing protein [Streptosporangium saharense]|uniref:DUF4388 domain-containing protein n=1 Tax=Streptosporangium saharense TaxID=1706840 RepID=UPI00331CB6B2